MNKSVLLKTTRIIINVLMYFFIAVSAVLLVVSLVLKNGAGDAMTIGGKQFRLIDSDSMAKCEKTDVSDFEIKSLPLHSLIFIETVPEDEEEAKAWFADLEVGDVLTFRYVYNGQLTITHRITGIVPKKTGGEILFLEGDNKSSTVTNGKQEIDTSKHFDVKNYNYVIGKVTGQSPVLGFLIYTVKQPVGMFCVVLVPCLIIITTEIIKIVGYFNEEKRKKHTAEKEQQDLEILRLKEQLAALQNNAERSSNTSTALEASPEPESLKENTPNE